MRTLPARRGARRLRPTLVATVLTLAACAALLAAAARSSDADVVPLGDAAGIELRRVAAGLELPVLLVSDGSGGRYVVEQAGRVTPLLPDGSVGSPLLDISGRVLAHHERGLLGLAFHPRFAENGRLFVAYSRRGDGATSISEFRVPPEPEPVDGDEEPAEPVPLERTERPLLVVAQPYTTHKGGMLVFDADGMLVISSGDGGSAWDPHGHGQDPASLLGKILRIDVDRGWPYAIPPDNGFAGVEGARGEVHAIGLRNPWRVSVDERSGDLVIADVGQTDWEEVNVLRHGERGVSFGWNVVDGPACRAPDGCSDRHRAPAVAYPHVDGDIGHCAVVGGHVYRGAAGTLSDGSYVYADYCSGTIWGVAVADLVAGAAQPLVLGRLDPETGQVLGFGRDDDGELYVLTDAGEVLLLASG